MNCTFGKLNNTNHTRSEGRSRSEKETARHRWSQKLPNAQYAFKSKKFPPCRAIKVHEQLTEPHSGRCEGKEKHLPLRNACSKAQGETNPKALLVQLEEESNLRRSVTTGEPQSAIKRRSCRQEPPCLPFAVPNCQTWSGLQPEGELNPK